MKKRRTILIAVDVETESDDSDLSESVKARLSEFYPDGDGSFLQPDQHHRRSFGVALMTLEEVLAAHGRCGYMPTVGAYECGTEISRSDVMWADHYAAVVRAWLTETIAPADVSPRRLPAS